jgi:hypothetical protein
MQDTERHDPRFVELDTWDTGTMLAALWEGQMRAVAALGPALHDLGRAVEAALPRLRDGGTLFYAGAGTSGRDGFLRRPDAQRMPKTAKNESCVPVLKRSVGFQRRITIAERAKPGFRSRGRIATRSSVSIQNHACTRRTASKVMKTGIAAGPPCPFLGYPPDC